MVVAERIKQYLQRLPPSLQTEVLDFVEYLVAKVQHETTRQDELAWSDLSLAMAMRGMEDEDMPTYTTADLKVEFS